MLSFFFYEQTEGLPFHRELSQSPGWLLAPDFTDEPHVKTASSEEGSDET